MKIIFYGTSEFGIPSLDILLANAFNIIAIVTVEDKPAGRGKKIHYSPVKEYAIAKNIKLLQPARLDNPIFIDEIKKLKPDLQIVIAFRKLPQPVWQIAPMGTFNLHASLLPKYRGAAPINRAVMNGEKETGVTTFFINNDIDAGNIILQDKTPIAYLDTAGDVFNKLQKIGAEVVLRTVHLIQNKQIKLTKQIDLINEKNLITNAPKIFKQDCRINWNNDIEDIYNFVRGLSPYPAAFTEFIDEKKQLYHCKILNVTPKAEAHNQKYGSIYTDNAKFLGVFAKNGLIFIEKIQLSGKNLLQVADFLRGFKINSNWIAC